MSTFTQLGHFGRIKFGKLFKVIEFAIIMGPADAWDVLLSRFRYFGESMFSGSMVALVTPMHENGAVDEAAFERLVAWHLEVGTDALVVLGTTGEAPALSSDEKEWLVKTTVSMVQGKCPVIVGAGSNITQHTVGLAQEAVAWGADALLIVTPYYNRPTQAGLVRHYQAVAESVSTPIILYNVPGRTGCDLLPATAIELAQLDNIVAIKEATGQLERVSQILRATDQLAVLSGDDATASAAMMLGAKGVISVVANVVPELMKQLCDYALAGRVEDVKALDQILSPLYSHSMINPNPIPTKWMLEQMGLISSGIRLPLVPLEQACHDFVMAAMKALNIPLKA